MNPFKVGDRVRVYGEPLNAVFRAHETKGTIERIDEDGDLEVCPDNGSIRFLVSPKQCRRLVKKERRRIWVHENALSEKRMGDDGWHISLGGAPTAHGPGPWIEFIEVRRKK